MEFELLTTPQVAEEMNVQRATVNRWILRGLLESYYDEAIQRHFITRQALDKFKAKKRRVGRPPKNGGQS